MGARRLKKILEKRARVAALAGRIRADQACAMLRVKPRWKVPPVAWGRRVT